MKRRDFLRTAGVGGLGIVIGACAPTNPGPAQPAAATTPEKAAQAATQAPAQEVKQVPPTQAAKDETYVMVSNVGAHPYWLDAKQGGDDAAAQLGVKFVYTGPAAYDTPAQVTQIEQIISTKPAGLIIPALQPDAVGPAIDKAIAAGIPVVTVDTDAPASQRMTYLGTDNYQAGRVMGQAVVEALNGKGKVGISTVPGQFNLEERIRGIKDVLKDNPGVAIAATVNNQADDAKAADVVTAMLQANQDINMVVSINATGAGVATALKQTNNVGKVKAVLFDITDPILAAVEDGTVDATLVQRTYMMGYDGVKMLYDYNHPTKYLQKWQDNKIVTMPNAVDTGVMVIGKDQLAAFKK